MEQAHTVMDERILIIQLKRIGDFILTAPALARLRHFRPKAEIVLLVPSGLVELAGCLPMVDRVIGFAAGRLNARAWASALAGSWDLCLDFSGTDRTALLTRLSRARLRVGYKKFAGNGLKCRAYHRLCEASVRDLHTVDFHQALVDAALGLDGVVDGTSPEVMLKIPQAAQMSLEEKLSGLAADEEYVVIHPGTARTEKFWLDDRWIGVIKTAREKFALQVVLTGTGTGLEKEPLERIRRGLTGVKYFDLCGRLSLVEMAAVVLRAKMIVGVDSMAMHLAALARRPQVALYGPTNPYHWRARHDKSLVLKGDSGKPVTEFTPKCAQTAMGMISIQSVVDAMASLL